MKRLIRRFLRFGKTGFGLVSAARALGRYLAFFRDYQAFKERHNAVRQDMRIEFGDIFPCLGENTATTAFDAHYVYHTAWAARKVQAYAPPEHVDVSSSLYFASIVSAFVPIRFLDYRPAGLNLTGLDEESGDLLNLPLQDGSVESLSCMHVVEHVGLGRYGDPLDPLGDRKAASELERVLAEGGRFLFVVPVGHARIFFNAHRVYHPEQVSAMFPRLKLLSFALVTDAGQFRDPAPLELVAEQSYGCGCFEFVKEPRAGSQDG